MSNNELTFRDLILFIRANIIYLISRYVIILICVSLGIILGFVYAYFSPKMYTAEVNVVSEANEGGGIGALNMLGLGSEQNPGVFTGDNLVWLYQSQTMIKSTFLTQAKIGKDADELLINQFIQSSPEVEEFIEKQKDKGKVVQFDSSDSTIESLNIEQNRLLNFAYRTIVNDYLTVETEEKTKGIIKVSLSHYEESFALNFVMNLVKKVNNYYIETTTSKYKDQVRILESKVENFDAELNKSLSNVATSVENIPYANPNLKSLSVPTQRSSVDVQKSSTSYIQTLQQLEAAKIRLAEQTPLIQIVDKPTYPLSIEKINPIKTSLIGGILALVLGSLFIVLRKGYLDLIKND